MQKIIFGLGVLAVLLALGVAPVDASTSFYNPHICNGKQCLDFTVTCGGLSPKTGTVHVSQAPGAQHNVFLLSGGLGTGLYSDGSYRAGTVDFVKSHGGRAIEVEYDYPGGRYLPGEGFTAASCRFADIAESFNNIYPVSGNVCAQGNSAGAVSLQNGMVFHGLDDVLDVAVFTGGPMVNYAKVCGFDDDEDLMTPSSQTSISNIVEKVVGLQTGHCKDSQAGTYELTQAEIDLLEEDSVLYNDLTKKPEGDYDYSAKTFFVNSASDVTNLNNHGSVFHDVISAPENQEIIIGGVAHDVDNTFFGSAEVQDILNDYCLI